MEEIIFLGTGNATVKDCYNTCFAIKNLNEYVLVDAGGGNGILKQLDLANISLNQIHHMIITHCHTDHILGAIWVYRMIATQILQGTYSGDFYIYCHDEAATTLKTILELTLVNKMVGLLDNRIFIKEVRHLQTCIINHLPFTFFDIHSTKMKQFGFYILDGNQKLTCLGDEPCDESCLNYVKDATWLLCEAFCLYDQRDIFKPYEKHHSTAKDASILANQQNAKNLVLYHTEEKNLKNREELYTQEAKQYFKGNVYVPNDLDVITIS